MVTIEQERAKAAFAFAETANKSKGAKEYSSHAKKAPMYILNNGLINFLAFAHQKGKEWGILSDNIREWFEKHDPKEILRTQLANNKDPFVKIIAELKNEETLRLVTAETLSLLAWLDRKSVV